MVYWWALFIAFLLSMLVRWPEGMATFTTGMCVIQAINSTRRDD
jgi:hypothetical protein